MREVRPLVCGGSASPAAFERNLRSGGDFGIDLTGDDARDSVWIHTIDAPSRETPQVLIKDESGACSYRDGPIPSSWWLPDIPSDWPGVLCRKCAARMREGGYTSLVDFRFSRDPSVPVAGNSARRGRSSECRPTRPYTETLRHGPTGADAVAPRTSGPARRAAINGGDTAPVRPGHPCSSAGWKGPARGGVPTTPGVAIRVERRTVGACYYRRR